MRFHLGIARLFALIACGLCAAPASAVFDLQVTEIWPGNEPGNNLSADWFEITNFGDTAWVAATDGDLYYDDESFDAAVADLMSGVDSIPAGSAAIFVVGGNANAVSDWTTLWSSTTPTSLSLFPVGSVDGAGLGQGGDAIGIWVTPGTPAGAPNFTASFPSADANGGQSYDVTLAAFSTIGNANGAVATTTLNDMSQAAIGSPGVRVPEPTSVVLLLASFASVAAAFRVRANG